MEHTDIDEAAWPERYVTGRLDAEDRALFEAHFVDCPACLDRLSAAEGLRTGLRSLGRTEARHTLRRRGASWAVRARVLTAGVCAAALLAAVGNLWQRARRAESQLALERAAVADSRDRLAEARAAMQSERTGRERLEASLQEQRGHPVQVSVLALLATRGAEVPTLALPATAAPVVLSVEREDPPRFQVYRATLLSATGEQRWQEETHSGSRDAVVLALDSSLLSPGSYLLLLEGAGKGGHWTPVGRHAFRAVASGPKQ